MTEIIRGNKQIAQRLDICEKTLKRWRVRHGLPIRYYPSGGSYLIIDEYLAWAIESDKRTKNLQMSP